MKLNSTQFVAMAAAVIGIALSPLAAADDDDDSGAAVNSTVYVKTVLPTEKVTPVQLTAYGTVNPDSRKTIHIVLPRPGIINKLAVSTGEEVRRGQGLFEFTTGSATVLAYRQAVSAVAFARTDVARTKELLGEKLATRSQLATSEKALSDAEQALQAQQSVGAGKTSEWITAPDDAVVTNIAATVGERMDRGGGVLELTERGAVQIHLGIEPERLNAVHVGMPVVLASVFGADQRINGRVDEVHAMINPQTRLVDAVVRLSKGAADGLLPGMQVRGVITLSEVKSWVLPRQAVLTDDDGPYLFQVKAGKAVRVNVKIVVDSDNIYGVEGPIDPKAGLVTLGNYELSNGTVVRETEVSAQAATSDKAGTK